MTASVTESKSIKAPILTTLVTAEALPLLIKWWTFLLQLVTPAVVIQKNGN